MSAITGVYAREILDSRGYPTVEVEVQLESGASGRAAVPSGASTGQAGGRGAARRRWPALRAARACSRRVRNVEETIGPEIDGMEATEQAAIDQALLELDGTPNKSGLGANAILAVSLAVARAAADAVGLPLYAYLGGVGGRLLPVPLMNVINGGAHADNGARHPGVHAGAGRRGELLVRPAMGAEIFHTLKGLLRDKRTLDRGGGRGRALPRRFGRARRRSICSCRPSSGRVTGPGDDVSLALDVAASEFAEEGGRYRLRREGVGAHERGDDRDLREPRRALPHRLHRGRPRRGRLGRLVAPDGAAGRADPARGRRSVRHQPRHHPAGHPGRYRQRRAHQAQPGGHAHRRRSRRSSWRSGRATARSSPTDRERRRTPSWPIWRWP